MYFRAGVLFSEELSIARILIHGSNYTETQRQIDWTMVSVDAQERLLQSGPCHKVGGQNGI
jgi:hypothetical protein